MVENKKMIRELRQFGASHARNGEARTSDLLFRAADHLTALDKNAKADEKRIQRLVKMRLA